MKHIKLNKKVQVALPKNIREKLSLNPGDFICFEVSPKKQVFLNKVKRASIDQECLRALSLSMIEWSSPHDEQAYEDL